MRKYLLVAVLTLLVFFAIRYFIERKDDSSTLEYNTQLIQKQIENVGKLVVTEGHFAEVITYKDRDKYLMDMLSFEKKALVIVNADVSVSYDLHQVTYDIDKKNKTIEILTIPKEEIKIDPQLTFYDVEQTTLSLFTGDDYNKINKKVRDDLMKKVRASSLQSNAQNRLVSELSKMLILTSSMGWTLEYKGKPVADEKQLGQQLKN
ncbi:DUF4230 domain-containing protein [Flavobacterium silvaticum]|uniref:DUF4230 domain-containing protein n=1 Tax=Flavobacterium silvaticum TaxID=1852020 RepID=A0A972JF05_9FLAO|nr:DUF4230 domain-containing protein [Flavobacterium silvaticum]NMH26726.1 DUF4230 domain-containing protein [Flavobacterium silvaticum]